MNTTPKAEDWLVIALERREQAMKLVGVCGSPGCMCDPGNRSDRHVSNCHCYNLQHAMVELGKIERRFVHEVCEALKCSGSDSSADS